MLLLLTVFIVIVGIIAAGQSVEKYSNIITINASPKVLPLFQVSGDTFTQSSAADKLKGGRSNFWNEYSKCNIIDCASKNPVDNDYLAFLLEEQRRAKLAASRNQNKIKSPQKPRATCPPQLTFDDYNMSFLTDDEQDAENRLEDKEMAVGEADAKLKELENQYNQRKRETEDDINNLKMLRMEMDEANRQKKDDKFYAKAVDAEVKPWQKIMQSLSKDVQKVQKDVGVLNPALKDIQKQLNEIKSNNGAPAKKPSVASKIRKAFGGKK